MVMDEKKSQNVTRVTSSPTTNFDGDCWPYSVANWANSTSSLNNGLQDLLLVVCTVPMVCGPQMSN